jgi:L-galactono-1,4-lactone dehydrogenase
VYEPEDEDEVVRLMQKAIGEGWQLRVIGSAISPNGLGFSNKCMISMAQMDKVLDVDASKKQVRIWMRNNTWSPP